MQTATFDTVLINGSVGTGKTTTAEHVGAELRRLNISGAVIDVDGLRNSWPAPAGDPFLSELALSNLTAVSANFRRAGAVVVIAAAVVEDVDELHRYESALGGRRTLHVRLTASSGSVAERLRARHRDDEPALAWHLRRHPELEAILARAGFVHELLLDTTTMTRSEAAGAVVQELVRPAVAD